MALTLESLSAALQASFSANKAERDGAEQAIKSLEDVSVPTAGHSTELLGLRTHPILLLLLRSLVHRLYSFR